MAIRHRFGGSQSDWVFNFSGTTLIKSPAAVVKFYTALSGGTQYTDLTSTGGGAISSVTSDANGELPEFYGPAGIYKMAADGGTGTGPRRWVYANDGGGSLTVAPSGDTTGATDPATVQALYNLGACSVELKEGVFYGNTPVTMPPYSSLTGAWNSSQVAQASGGTTWKMTSGFTGKTITDGSPVTLSAAILLLGQTFGGYSTVSEEQKIRNIQIDGTSAPAGVTGIQSYGRLQRVHLTEVLVSKMTADGLVQTLDAAGNQPDAWFGFKVFTRFCGGKGYSLRSADSTWYMCLSSNNGDTGVDWFINTTSNSKYYACRSEHAAGLGFGFVCTNSANSSGDVLFQGCSTDQSTLHGMQIGGTINSVASFVHATPVIVNGCTFRRDGANGGAGGGGYAGLYLANYGSVVQVDGVNVFPGVDDAGTGTNSPQIGLLADAGSKGVVSGSHFHAATTAISDAAGLNYDNSVTTATGTTGSPTIVTSPNIAAYQGKSLSLLPGSAPAVDPLFINSANSAERALGIRVVGQGNDRFKLTSDGKIAIGPGSATQDIALSRPSAGILSVTDSGASGSAMLRVSASASQSGAAELFSAVCAVSADVAYIAKVTGDTNNRLVVDSNGLAKWGSGSAAPDTALQRVAGRLDVSTDGAAGAFAPVDPSGGGYGFFGASGQLGHGTLIRASYTVANSVLTASGTVMLVAYYLPAGTPVTNVHFFTGTGTLKTGGTHGWYIVCTSDRKIRAASADQTDAATVWGVASTDYGLPVLTSTSTVYVTPTSGLYYLGMMVAQSAGSLPNLVAGPAMSTGVAGIAPALSFPCTGGSGTAQTTPPTADGSVILTAGSADGTKNYLCWVT